MTINENNEPNSKLLQLQDEIKDREFEINLLKEISLSVHNQLDLSSLLKLVAERAQNLVQAKTLLIPLLNKEHTEYTYKAGHGENTEEILGESLPIDFGICGWVWKHKRPWWRGVLKELTEDEKNTWEKQAGSVLVVPLNGKRSFLGGIAAINKIELDEFTRRDMELLMLFATQVTIAIENSLFFEETIAEKNRSDKLANELEKLTEDLEVIIEDRTTSLQVTNKELQKTITSLKDTQDQLIHSEKMASLGGLVAGISHEINTPIGISITSASHIDCELININKKLIDNSMKKSDLETFFKTCNTGITILNRNLKTASELIRSFKQVAVDQSSNEYRTFNLREYVDEVILSLHPKLKLTTIKVTNSISEKIIIHTSPGSISQILTNLIINSIIHAFPSGNKTPDKTIKISAKKTDSKISIDYSDNGDGMNKEQLNKLFDPFFTTKRGQGGSGLGMSIVYNLTTSLEGSIEAESAPGKGLHLTVNIPLENT